MHRLLFAGALALACASLAVPAHAADVGTAVSLPWGDWLAGLAPLLNTVLIALIGWLFRKLPGNFVAILKTMQADQLLTRAIDYALNAVAGAAKGKVLTVDVANQVLAEALNYAIAHGAGWLVTWLGGETAIAEKIVARLSLEEVATVVPAGNGSIAIAAGLVAAPA